MKRNLLLALLLGVSTLARAFTPTFTATLTDTVTLTDTLTPSYTSTFTPTITLTTTPTPAQTATSTPTVTPTVTPIQCALTTSYVADYQFENNGNDSSGNGYNLTAVGNIPYSSVVYKQGAYSVGPFNSLPGPNYFTVPTASTLDALPAFSVAVWFYNSDNTDNQIIYYEIDGGTNQYIQIHVKNGKVGIDAAGTGIAAVMPAVDNAWHLLTFVDNYGYTQIYIDATLQVQGNLPYPTTTVQSAYIGALPGGPNGGSPVLTYLDDYRVFNCVLSASEITTMATAPTATPTFSISPTYTSTPTPSASPTITGTVTGTATPTSSPTVTQTVTQTWTQTATPSPTPNGTFTATPSNTPNYTHTWTPTTSPTLTSSPTPTWSPTSTITPTATPTTSATMTQTPVKVSPCGSCVELVGNYAPVNMTWTAVQANPTAVVYQSNCNVQPCDAYIAVPSSTTYTWLFWSMQPLGVVPGTPFSITPGGPYQAKLPALKVGDQVSVQAVGAPTTPVTTPGTLRFDATQ